MDNLQQGAFAVPRRSLFEVWIRESDKNKKNNALYLYILNRFGLQDIEHVVKEKVIRKIKIFGYQISERWQKSHRIKDKFLKANESWLEVNVSFSELELLVRDAVSQPSTSQTVGRPKKLFKELSEKSKRRRVQLLLKSNTKDELVYAAQASLVSEGKRDAAALIKEAVYSSPKRATHIKKAYFASEQPKRQFTCEEALSIFLDGKMSKRSYLTVQQRLKSIHCKVLPSYPYMLKTKKECYPDRITITEISAEIDLQALVNHTTKRICRMQAEVLDQIQNELQNVQILFKWGCDGSSGYSRYKQRYSERSSELEDDSAMFVISLVPIQLYNIKDKRKTIIWQNPAPSSTRYCRPIKIIQKAESDNLIKTETNNIEEQISKLSIIEVRLENYLIKITPKLLFTMVDTKICNSLLDVSSQTCYICGSTPKEMNKVKSVQEQGNDPEVYRFGLSPLHAKIRVLECLLKISYRLEVRKWQARGEEVQRNINKRKEEIQRRFKKEMGLLVDVVKQGYGTTNDGNTARRFFENPMLSSSITGIEQKLIEHFSILLQAISSGYDINLDAFKKHAENTLAIYLQHYSWYYMPVTVHKLLVHGTEIIKYALLPIGQLSEDAQECRHKELRKFRESSSRKFSRTATMTDVIHMLLVSSDPYINSLRQKVGKPLKKLSPEVLSLLKPPSHDIESSDDLGSDSDSMGESNIYDSDSDSD